MIRKAFKKICPILMFAVFAASCSSQFNISRKTPRKESKPPKFTQRDSLMGSSRPERDCFDVLFYKLAVTIEPIKQAIYGAVDTRFAVLQESSVIQMDLFPELSVTTITQQGKPLKFERKYNALFIYFDAPLLLHDTVNIQIQYQGTPQIAAKPPWEGGFVWETDGDGKPYIGVACEGAGASLWWPCKDVLTDEPDSMQLSFTVPQGLVAVSNGRLRSYQSNADGSETYNWAVNNPINNYNATVYVGNYKHFTLPYLSADTVHQLDFYVLPPNLEKAKNHFKQAADVIRFFEKTFGEYPWWTDGYKLIESPYAGMEHQTAIAYGNGYKNYGTFNFDYIILHETAHEWWGNSLTATDLAEIWLHEGFATYAEALYVEHLYGLKGYHQYINFYSMITKNRKPLIGPYGVRHWEIYDSDVYFKGAQLLHTLRNLYHNDDRFFALLKDFYAKYRKQTVTNANFVAMAQAKYGEPLDWFFGQYLLDRRVPILETDLHKDPQTNKWHLYYRWKDTRSDFRLPVGILLPNGKLVSITPGTTLKRLVVDSDDLKINIRNNFIARKTNKRLHKKWDGVKD